MTASATLLLLADGRFPTGAHAHSAGVEASHGRGDIRSIDDVAAFLDGRLATVGPVDAAFSAAACASPHPLVDLDGELSIRMPSPRLRSVSRSLGRQLLRAAQRSWPQFDYSVVGGLHPEGPMQPIALGVVARAGGLSAVDAALCSLHHLVGAVTTAAIRLMGLDPFDVHALAAQRANTLYRLAVEAASSAQADPAELPSTTSLLADALAEHHATWEVRLFAS
jgi:urease accessory protein